MVPVPESVYAFCWALVVFLALAAAFNHGWHHARDRHLTTRLARASGRDTEQASFELDREGRAVDGEVTRG